MTLKSNTKMTLHIIFSFQNKISRHLSLVCPVGDDTFLF